MAGKQSLLVLILVLGPGVLLSYYFAAQANTFGVDALWGNIPDKLKLVYPLGMLIAAIGFFPFAYYSIFKSTTPHKYLLGFILILIPSIAWMPLTVSYLHGESFLKWMLLRLVLFLVPLGAILILRQIRVEQAAPNSSIKKWAIFGLYGFIFHTLILDGLVWPFFFH